MSPSSQKAGGKPIVALASGRGPAAIAIIRVSGASCHTLLNPFISKDLSTLESRTMSFSRFMDRGGQTIDEIMVATFKGKSSFTGEDSAEIFCHGGPYIIEKIISILTENGFAHAEPGEFTQRAFLNGKLDLTKAEGIKELTSALTEHQWQAASQLSSGKFEQAVQDLRKLLIEAMALLEAKIDFPEEHDAKHISTPDINKRVDAVKQQINQLLHSYENGKVASSGLKVVFIGPPNAGKSTLLNTLCNKERAIVTEIAGTTRDYIEEKIIIQGRLFELVDTAGLRDSDSKVERIGIEQSKTLIAQADLCLFLFPSDYNGKPDNEVQEWLLTHKARDYAKVMTKDDLPEKVKLDNDWIKISCQKNVGISQLEDLLIKKFDDKMKQLDDIVYVSAERHVHALRRALGLINQYYNSQNSGAYDELQAFELLEATKELGLIIGDIDTEDLLDEIFSKFCMGK